MAKGYYEAIYFIEENIKNKESIFGIINTIKGRYFFASLRNMGQVEEVEVKVKIEAQQISDGKYAIYGSGPLAVRGIREAKDLDVIVMDDLYQKLKKKYFNDPKKERIKIGEIEIYPVWAWGEKIKGLEKSIKEAELIQGLRFVHLKDLLKWKVKMGRPKDFEDIKLIKNYLKIKK